MNKSESQFLTAASYFVRVKWGCNKTYLDFHQSQQGLSICPFWTFQPSNKAKYPDFDISVHRLIGKWPQSKCGQRLRKSEYSEKSALWQIFTEAQICGGPAVQGLHIYSGHSRSNPAFDQGFWISSKVQNTALYHQYLRYVHVILFS